MAIKKAELDEIKRLGLTHLATLLESVADKEIESTLPEGESQDEKVVDMKSHFEKLFEGQEVSPEFVTKAQAIFEAAVAEQAEVLLAKKFAIIDEAVKTQLVEHQAEQDKRVDEYLDYVVKEWLTENQVAIESNVKVERATALIEGITKLLAENDIEKVEAEQEDKLAQAIAEHAETQEELVNAIRKINEAEKTILAMQVKGLIDEATKDMAESEAERFVKIVESLTVDSIESFTEKLGTIVESFKNTPAKVDDEVDTKSVDESTKVDAPTTEVVVEGVVEKPAENAPQVDSKMTSYINAARGTKRP